MTTANLSRNLYDDGTRRTVAALQADHLPRCTPADVGAALTVKPGQESPEATAAQRDGMERLAKYLSTFLPPGPCVSCGAVLGGGADNPLAAFLGMFQWGLAYGEGTCGRCGYPARGIHRIDLGDVGSLEMPAILQYHPDGLSAAAPSPSGSAQADTAGGKDET